MLLKQQQFGFKSPEVIFYVNQAVFHCFTKLKHSKLFLVQVLCLTLELSLQEPLILLPLQDFSLMSLFTLVDVELHSQLVTQTHLKSQLVLSLYFFLTPLTEDFSLKSSVLQKTSTSIQFSFSRVTNFQVAHSFTLLSSRVKLLEQQRQRMPPQSPI